ncbi:MAG TPA: zf-HC2 domain-containing protein [Burkholderiales bacterium]|nr:zf-HC2 domain-containing protein [Burkholderiales bacterium]
MSAEHPVAFEALAGYWLGELPAAEAEALEEHLFGCAHCAARLEWLAALSAGVRGAVRAGALALAVSAPFVEAMKRAGLRVREYRLRPGERVECTIRADDDAVIGRVRAPLAGVTRVDALERLEIGGVLQRETRLEDVPFDLVSGEVILIPSAAALRKLPANIQRLRLVAVGEQGETLLGDYTFAHTPS